MGTMILGASLPRCGFIQHVVLPAEEWKYDISVLAESGRNLPGGGGLEWWRGFITFDGSLIPAGNLITSARLEIQTCTSEGSTATWTETFYGGVTLDLTLGNLATTWADGSPFISLAAAADPPASVDEYIADDLLSQLVNADGEIVFLVRVTGDEVGEYIWKPDVQTAYLHIVYGRPTLAKQTTFAAEISTASDMAETETLASAAESATSLESDVATAPELDSDMAGAIPADSAMADSIGLTSAAATTEALDSSIENELDDSSDMEDVVSLTSGLATTEALTTEIAQTISLTSSLPEVS